MAQARIVFHLPARYLDEWREARHLLLFRRIEELFAPLGAQIVVRDRRDGPFQDGATRAYDDGDLHILETGRARGPGVLNASVAYLHPFWHLDPVGVLAESSIGARAFDASRIRTKPARAFYERMQARFPARRQSRREQEMQVTRFPAGAISVFLQGPLPEAYGLTYASGEAMLRAVAQGAGGRAVLVKAHPLAVEHDTEVIARVLADGVAVTPTQANVNDMIAASVATVSANSACAIEGFLQRKPALLFGRSDFHHLAETVRHPGGFPQALARVLAAPEPDYARFLFWYFARNCLNVSGSGFAQKVLRIFAQAGFAPDRLGIRADLG
ncbi:hypothetical protein [Pseudotabrizicola formosa]|uniref:hypothetical protein n=1 Tax=Pseudotabrizicola formosa TaxID=2030009 RepID=UPI000CD21A13|nr:hypothetical protein [Pseudotabrizicola formosa]